VVLAESQEQSDGTYKRVYPAGDLASHVVGYASTKYGTSGIEASQNDSLKGQQNYSSWSDVINAMAGIENPGNDVTLTINSKIQQAAQNALDGYKGACVVIDPETGAVLAMASSPTYDAQDAESLLDNSGNDSDGTLLNRATQSLYAPGSTFKMVTLSTALEDGIANEDTTYSSPGTISIGNADITNFGGRGYGTITLEQATWYSSNTVFAQVGDQMGAQKLVEGADKFGFDKQLNFDVSTATSVMSNPDEMTEWETAWAAVGQPVGMHADPNGPVATVLQMALVGCGIANDGVIMQPYLVDSVYGSNGEKSYSASPSQYLQALSSSTAERVRNVLKGVVTQGTGTAAAVPGVSVAGKTGTAETGKEHDDSWFVGMAPADDPKVVVAIVIEEGDSGMGAAKAQNVLKTALDIQGN
jgi:cell division protein FtsI/penicillin-binding protein 2